MWKSSVFEYCVVTFQFTFLFIYISKHIASFSRLSLSRLLGSRCFSSKIFAFHTFHDLSADCYFFFWVRLVEFFLFFIVVIISTNAKINTHRCVTDRSWLITLFCCAASLIFLRFLSTLCRECARDVVIDFRVVAYFCMIELLTICIDTHTVWLRMMFRCESKRYTRISLLSLSMIFWVELCMHIHFAVSCELNPNGSVVFGSRVHCIAYVSCPSLGCVDLNTHIKFRKMWTIRSDARHRMTRISNHPQVFPVFKLKITTAFSEPMNIWFVLVVDFEWLSDIECCF